MIIFIVIVSDIIKDFEYLYSLSYCIDIHEKINIEDTLSVRSNNIKYIENRALLGLSTQHFNNIMENRSISSNLKRFAEEAYDIDREMYRKYFCHGIYHTYWEHYAGNNLRERREILKSKKSNISLDSKFDKNLFNQEENIIMSICRKEPNIFKQYNQIIRIENININTLSNLSEKLIEYLCDVAFNYAKIIKDKFKFFSEHSINMLETWKNEFITAYMEKKPELGEILLETNAANLFNENAFTNYLKAYSEYFENSSSLNKLLSYPQFKRKPIEIEISSFSPKPKSKNFNFYKKKGNNEIKEKEKREQELQELQELKKNELNRFKGNLLALKNVKKNKVQNINIPRMNNIKNPSTPKQQKKDFCKSLFNNPKGFIYGNSNGYRDCKTLLDAHIKSAKSKGGKKPVKKATTKKPIKKTTTKKSTTKKPVKKTTTKKPLKKPTTKKPVKKATTKKTIVKKKTTKK